MSTSVSFLLNPWRVKLAVLGERRTRNRSPEACFLGFAWPFPGFRASFGARWTPWGQGAQACEVVSSHRQGQQLIHLVQPPHHDLPDRADHLAPAEALLDALSLALAHLVARMPGCACVDGAATGTRRVLSHMRRNVHVAARLHEAPGVVGLVRAHGDALSRAGHIREHVRGNVPFGRAVTQARAHVDHQPMAVVGEHMAQVARQRRSGMALAVKPRVRVARRLMRRVAARLAAPILGGAVVVRAVTTPQALVTRPGLDQRAVHTEVLAREQSSRIGHLHRGVEQVGGHVVFEESVAVLAEHRVVPHRVLDRQAHEPAKQQVVTDLLHKLPLAAHAVEHLQEHRPDQLLGRDTRPPALHVGLVHRRELGIQLRQGLIDPYPDRPKRVVDRNKLFQPDRAEQALVVVVGSAHTSFIHRRDSARCSPSSGSSSMGFSTAC